MTRYVPTNTPASNDVPNLQRWLREEYQRLQNCTDDIYSLADIVKALFVVAGYGGIGLDAVTPLNAINATRQVLPFDVELVAVPRAVDYVLGSNGLAFSEPGVWRMNAKISLEFLEAQAGRRMAMQLYNVSTAQDVGPVFNFGVGRNTDAANLNFNLLVTIAEEILGDVLLLRVFSTSDTFTGVQAIGSIWDVNLVSEYQGDIFDQTRAEISTWQ